MELHLNEAEILGSEANLLYVKLYPWNFTEEQKFITGWISFDVPN